MNNKEILKEYAEIGIKSPDDLYDYIISNDQATINNTNFNLSCSNEVIEFMASFLSALKYKVIRLYFEKKLDDGKKFSHWFLIFKNGNRWYYFEPVLEEFRGQFGFDAYNEILFFIVDKLNQLYNAENKTYILKEISSLSNNNLDDNIKQSLNGTDVFISNYITPKKKSNEKVIDSNNVLSLLKNLYLKISNYDLFYIFITLLIVCIIIMLIWIGLQPGGII